LKHALPLDLFLLNLILWRGLLPPDGFVVSEPAPAPGRVNVWWGATLEVQPGDRICSFATPWGAAFDHVIPAERESLATEESS